MRALRPGVQLARTAMEFGILGPLRVSSGDGALDLGAPAQRALVARSARLTRDGRLR